MILIDKWRGGAMDYLSGALDAKQARILRHDGKEAATAALLTKKKRTRN